MEKKYYIHYGSSEFHKDKFEPITNCLYFNKPYGGLWASPIGDDVFGWFDWCTFEEFNISKLDKHFIFSLKDDSKILTLKTKRDVYELSKDVLRPDHWRKTVKDYKSYSDFLDACENMRVDIVLNFEKLLALGYDAIEYSVAELYFELYGWDCDCILVLNPDCIVMERIEKGLLC